MEGELLELPAEIKQEPRQFTVSQQKVHLELDFSGRLHGFTEIIIHPLIKEIQSISLHARQCQVNQITVNKRKPPPISYTDPCEKLCLHTESDIHQHHVLSAKLQASFAAPAVEELVIKLPKQVKIEEVNQLETQTASAGIIRIPKSDEAVDVEEAVQGLADTSIAKFTPLTVIIHFESIHVRDALQFVTGSGRWPHVYTRGGYGSGRASALFPCVDTIDMRCTWEISLKSARTVGAALRQLLRQPPNKTDGVDLAHGEREMIFIGPGEITDEIVDKEDPSKKTVSYKVDSALSAQQIGFTIGPFEKVNLGEFRDAQEIQELGKKAVDMTAYCLPGRTDEAKNTCLPLTMALDYFVKRYVAYPYSRFGICFVEDVIDGPYIFSELSFCSTRMLYPEDVIDPVQEVTRQLVHTISSQWLGMDIIAEEPRDQWVIIGGSHFLADIFMKELCGNNEYRYRMKRQSNQVVDLDQERPSIHEMGAILHVDPSVHKFMALKCPVVFFVLDRRMAKVTGTSKMPAILAKVLMRARMDDLPNNMISTDFFQRMVEKFYHHRIDDFMLQWVKGAGCPRFQATQRFNKKKLVIELQIRQIQVTHAAEKELEVDTFMRDVREDYHGVWAAEPQKVFTGPMTIRIHEADGTPYEHIVEIKDAVTTVDIPYNTKYKRLKRTKKQKSRAAAAKTTGEEAEEGDALLYCLGDVLQSEEDTVTWKLTDWTAEEEEKMSAESFEWMRLDADFEWIAHTKISMGGHMFVSQLQQDRDVIAQLDSVNVMAMYAAQSLVSTILLRTMMDIRYFHGIRTAAAEALVKHAKKEVNYIGLFHLKKTFETLYMSSENESAMTRPNDFSNQLSYYLQCALVEAISKVRDDQGVAPPEVKEFLLDKLKFNDNSANDYSDSFYVSRLMQALTHAVIARPAKPADTDMDDDDISSDKNIAAWTAYHRAVQLEHAALEEIDRYRRMDEWTSSYRNLYSRTALDCQARLADAGVGAVSPLHFLQYTRPANYVSLRITAYDILIRDPALFDDTNTRSRSILRYIIHCMAADSSSEIRHALSVGFGKALARQAIGDGSNITTTTQPTGDGTSLVVENANIESETTNIENAQREKLRRQTIEGATEALKAQTTLPQNENLKKFLWTAVCYPECGFEDLKVLLEFCRLVFEAKDQAVVKLDMPRYWKVTHLGKGKLVFRRTTKVRTRIVPIWKPKTTALATTAAAISAQGANGGHAPAPRPLKLNFKSQSFKASSKASTQVSATPTPPPPSHISSSTQGGAAQSGRIVLKLKKQNPE